MPRVVVVTPPDLILSVEDAKLHLRVDDDAEDTLIEAMIKAAIGTIDGPMGWLGLSLGQQTLEWRGDAFPCWEHGIRLPCGPLGDIVSVGYDDRDGAAQVVSPADYEVHGEAVFARRGFAWPATSCRPEAVRIRYEAGHAPETVPESALAAVKLMVGDLYRWRETVSAGAVASVPMSTTVAALLSPLRVWI